MNTPLRLLLVEDNPGDALRIEELLECSLHPPLVTRVTHLSDARNFVQRQPTDLVLLDLYLPDGSGVDCVDGIREHAEVPIIVLTGTNDDALAQRCIVAGADDYLVKGRFAADELARSIGYSLARSDAREERSRAEVLRARLAAVASASPDAIISIKANGQVTGWNTAASRIFGINGVGCHLRTALGSTYGEPSFAEARRRAMSGPPQKLHLTLGPDQGGRELSVQVFSLATSSGQELSLICRDVTDELLQQERVRQSHEEALARNEQMRQLTARLSEVREDERARLSREVHDELGQALSAIKMDIRWVERHMMDASAEDRVRRLKDASQTVDEAVAKVQSIAIELRPSALDTLGLAAAIRDEVRRFSVRSEIEAELLIQTQRRPSDEVGTALFRVLQELLTNVARHARATRVAVGFDASTSAWTMTVEDDGVGFPESVLGAQTSLGLLVMHERLHGLGGRLTLENLERGARAVASVPNPTPCAAMKVERAQFQTLRFDVDVEET